MTEKQKLTTSSPCLAPPGEKKSYATPSSSLLRLAESQGSNAGSGWEVGWVQPRPLCGRSAEEMLCRCLHSFPVGACAATGNANGRATTRIGLLINLYLKGEIWECLCVEMLILEKLAPLTTNYYRFWLSARSTVQPYMRTVAAEVAVTWWAVPLSLNAAVRISCQSGQ